MVQNPLVAHYELLKKLQLECQFSEMLFENRSISIIEPNRCKIIPNALMVTVNAIALWKFTSKATSISSCSYSHGTVVTSC